MYKNSYGKMGWRKECKKFVRSFFGPFFLLLGITVVLFGPRGLWILGFIVILIIIFIAR